MGPDAHPLHPWSLRRSQSNASGGFCLKVGAFDAPESLRACPKTADDWPPGDFVIYHRLHWPEKDELSRALHRGSRDLTEDRAIAYVGRTNSNVVLAMADADECVKMGIVDHHFRDSYTPRYPCPETLVETAKVAPWTAKQITTGPSTSLTPPRKFYPCHLPMR